MIGVLVNVAAVVIGSLAGLLCKKGIPQKFADAIMTGIALCTLYIGISGALKGNNTIVLIISMVLGVAVGTLLDIDGALTRLGNRLEERFKKEDGGVSIAQGFVTASLLFCVGAMTVVGSINAGLGDNEMLFTKSVLDLISAIMLSVSLGIGVLFSAVFVLVFQGALALFAGVLSPVLSEAAVAELVCAGSVMIIALGLNMLRITKIKVADFLPALIFAPLITSLLQLF